MFITLNCVMCLASKHNLVIFFQLECYSSVSHLGHPTLPHCLLTVDSEVCNGMVNCSRCQ